MSEVGVVSGRKLWIAGFQMPYVKALQIGIDIPGQDDTVEGDLGRSEASGLEVAMLEAAGLVGLGTGEPEDILYAQFGLNNVPVSVGPVAGADGERGYFFRARVATYKPGGAVGEMYRYDVSARGTGGNPMLPGWILKAAQVSATVNGTAYNLGAVASTQKLYAALHVTERTGDRTIDAKIESDDASGMVSPISRITFAQLAAIGAEYATPVAGAITDDWWRTVWTIGGTTGNITAVVLMAIK